MSLYTKYNRTTLLAAEISNVYVPELEELTNAFDKMAKRGWIDQMREDIKSVNNGQLDDEVEENLCQDSPNWSINIRFRPSDVTMFDPMRIVREDHKIARNFRYQPYNRDNEPVPLVDDVARTNNSDEQTRSELQHIRAAQHATTVDRQHVRLQNRLYSSLKLRYGDGAVRYEQDYVELKVVGRDGCIFFEIKTDTTAKKCIRNAIGQLLEYSSYPAEQRAQKLVVVGDAPATNDDGNYLQHLREQYSLPIYYAQFNWEKENLESET